MSNYLNEQGITHLTLSPERHEAHSGMPGPRQKDAGTGISSRLEQLRKCPELADQMGYSVEGLAKHCGVSVRKLQKYFANEVGEPPREWIKQLRMTRALDLLRTGSNVSETARALGYADRSHFSREFTKVHGAPPRTFMGKVQDQPRSRGRSRLAT